MYPIFCLVKSRLFGSRVSSKSVSTSMDVLVDRLSKRFGSDLKGVEFRMKEVVGYKVRGLEERLLEDLDPTKKLGYDPGSPSPQRMEEIRFENSDKQLRILAREVAGLMPLIVNLTQLVEAHGMSLANITSNVPSFSSVQESYNRILRDIRSLKPSLTPIAKKKVKKSVKAKKRRKVPRR